MSKIQIRLTEEETAERCKLIGKLNDIVGDNKKIEREILDALFDLEVSFVPTEQYHLAACVRDFINEYID